MPRDPPVQYRGEAQRRDALAAFIQQRQQKVLIQALAAGVIQGHEGLIGQSQDLLPILGPLRAKNKAHKHPSHITRSAAS